MKYINRKFATSYLTKPGFNKVKKYRIWLRK